MTKALPLPPTFLTFLIKLYHRFIAHLNDLVLAVAVDFEKWHVPGLLILVGLVLICLGLEVALRAEEG